LTTTHFWEIIMMEIKEQDYSIRYDTTAATLCCIGTLRLIGVNAYTPFSELLDQVVELEPPMITVNLRQLKSINSSGITTFAKFVIKVSQKENIQMVIQGSKQIAWQGKSLINLKRLMPRLQLEWE
jgi:hypothetical protein